MRKRLTLQASGNSYFEGYECEHCGSHQVLACETKTPYCAYCGKPLKEGTPVSRAEITASPDNKPIYVKCVSCDTVFAVDGTNDTAAELAASKYCPQCSGDSFIPCTASGETDEGCFSKKEDDKYLDDSDGSESPAEETKEVQDQLDDGVTMGDAPIDEENAEMEASSYNDLQWSALDTDKGELTAMVASSKKTGNPLAIFRKENAPASMQPLFAQTLFVSAFNEVAGTDGMAAAVKAFGGSYFNQKMFTAADIEKAALTKMQATAIPKLIDCCQMAVEGGTKGIYPDVFTSLQRSIVNELVASGVDSDRASQAVTNTFAIHGSDLFGTIIAKAMELYTKPDTVRAEAKSMIMQASTTVPKGFQEQMDIRKAMEKPTPNFGTLNITANVKDNSDDFETLRRQLF